MKLKKILNVILTTAAIIFPFEILAVIILVISALMFGIFGEDTKSMASPSSESSLERNYE